ncbi:MAG: hypothetical protein KDA38_07730, partial [Planctomycetales bacterium]|nr:hypothetical protein [Planctomycetales bacterium]
QVKRIVGLPGELVAIRDGDLLVDDQIARKTLDEFRQMAILVFDDNWSRSVTARVPTGSTWEGRSPRQEWRRDGDGYSFVGPNPRDAFGSGSDREHFSGRDDELQWLEFDMRRRYLAASEQISTPMLDVYGYNQSLSRELQTAHDLLCVTRLRVNDADVTVWRLKDGQERFELWSDWRTGRLRLLHNDRLVWARNVGWLSHPTGGMVEVALVDRQVIFAVDGVTWLRYPYESTQPRNDILRPIAIGGLRGSFRVDQIRVYRDVHYLHAYGVGWPWKASRPLAEDEYFVLGDNSPASMDSRQLGGRFIVREQILGRVWRSRLP